MYINGIKLSVSMGIFSRKDKEVKSTSTNAALITMLALGNVGFAQSAVYKSNPYVRRAVDLIASAASSVPALIIDRRENEIESKDHPLKKLLARPNPLMGWKEYVQTAITHLEIHGNAYIYIDDTIAGRALYPIDPEKVTPLQSFDTLNPILNYRVDFGEGQLIVQPDKIIHIKFHNPTDPMRGLSPMVSAAQAILVQQTVRDWNLSTTKNGAKPSMAINVPNEMDGEQFKEFKDKIQEGYSGSGNTGAIMILDGGKEAKPLGFTAVEMDYLNAMTLFAREIAIAYGVPPEKLGDSANKTYSNAVEANKEFAHDTIIPILDMFYSAHNRQIAVMFKDVSEIKYDVEQVPGLKGDQTQQYTAVNNIDFMTINEKRDLFGYDDIGTDGDVIMVRMGLTPLRDAVEPLDKPPMQE